MDNVLFINSVQQSCGCHSYGKRTFSILSESTKYKFWYLEVVDYQHIISIIDSEDTAAVIYNFHPLTMTWMQPCTDKRVKHLILWHEGWEHHNLVPDQWLYVSGIHDYPDNLYSLPRPLIEGVVFDKPNNEVPVISSFGFGFGSKNYGSIIKMVNEQFDEAIIRLHIPRAFYGDNEGQATAGVLPGIWNEMKKPNIKLEITHEFLSDYELLKFLSQSDLTIFLYELMEGRGLSSVIDYALSVDVPIAINDSTMFRHIQNEKSNVANNSLRQIMDNGIEHLKVYKEKWSNENLIKKYEEILDKTL